MRILAISGSLRYGSFNRGLLEAAQELAPSGVQIQIQDLHDLPMFDPNGGQDDDAAVRAFQLALRESDAVLIATPEYNHSIPGVLSNALEWASRPARQSPMRGMPTGIVSASPGAVGGARAQEHLKLVLGALLARPLPHAGVVVGKARERFTGGVLSDENTRAFLADYVSDLAEFARMNAAFSQAA